MPRQRSRHRRSIKPAAKLLWEAARGKEPWAIQELCRRFAPQTQSLHLIHEVDEDKVDYSKLSDDQIRQLELILEQASTNPVSAASGEGEKKAA